MDKPGNTAAKHGHDETSPTSTPAKKPRTDSPPQESAASARLEPVEPSLVADLTPDPAIEADDTASDGGYESDTASRASTSVCSTVRDYEFENNRRYHRFQEGRYQFPNDEPEQEREDMKHAMVVHLCEGKLHYAPLEDPQNILDIGTGTGIWAIDSKWLAFFGGVFLGSSIIAPTDAMLGQDNVTSYN